MKNYKNKIIAGVIIILALAASFWWGGNSDKLHGWSTNADTDTEAFAQVDSDDKTQHTESDKPSDSDKAEQQSDNEQAKTIEKTVTDKYKTEPVPEGKPMPVEPEGTTITDDKLYCTLSVDCYGILAHKDYLSKEKAELIPQDGVILPETKAEFYEGESVFNVLQRELKKARIHLEFTSTPMYNSVYIEGINNFYEFDAGELSGWIYSVNGWTPNYGCSRYKLKNGDIIKWSYTCDRNVRSFYEAGENDE